VRLPGGELRIEDLVQATEHFAAEHERFYGYHLPGEELEILTFKISAVGTRHDLAVPHLAEGPMPDPIGTRAVVFSDSTEAVDTPLYDREILPAKATISGPALLGQTDSTTLLPPGSTARVDEHANLHITI
jgi:N-methylhydantoinase A